MQMWSQRGNAAIFPESLVQGTWHMLCFIIFQFWMVFHRRFTELLRIINDNKTFNVNEWKVNIFLSALDCWESMVQERPLPSRCWQETLALLMARPRSVTLTGTFPPPSLKTLSVTFTVAHHLFLMHSDSFTRHLWLVSLHVHKSRWPVSSGEWLTS